MTELKHSETSAFARGTRGERLIVGFMSMLLLPLSCAGAYLAHDYGVPRASNDWQGRMALFVLLTILVEVSIAFAVFCAIALVWAVLKPNWAERVLALASSHVWHAILLLAGGCTALAIALWLVETLL